MSHMNDASVRRIMRPAIRSGLSVVNRAAKRLVPKRHGRLKKAIGVKVGKSSANGVSGRVYVRAGYEGTENGRQVDPRKYAHLVEFGTRNKKATPFMRKAMGDSQAATRQAITQKARQRLRAEVAKARSKGKTL